MNIIRSGLVCSLLAGLAWGQTDKTNSTVPAQVPTSQVTPVSPDASAPPATLPGQDLAAVSADTPVITIAGLCDYASTGKVTDPSCKMVVTRAEFEIMARLARPKDPPQFATDIAHTYIESAEKAQKALQMGLDKKSTYPQRIEVLRLLFYAKMLNRQLEEQEWNKITEKQIEDYYHDNPQEYVIAEVQRIFLPRFPPDEKPGEKLSDAEKQKRQQEWDASLQREADSLRARAVAGEDYLKLQNEAYKFTAVNEVQGPESVVLHNVRRRHFDPDQKSVMDLKPGETSPVLYDPTRGYCIFRVDSKGMIPLVKVRLEIHKMFQTEGIKRDMDAIQSQAKITFNDAYLGPPSQDESDKSASNTAPTPPDQPQSVESK